MSQGSVIINKLLRDTLKIEAFINADVIASGLSAFAPDRAALPAGRIMLRRMKELAELRGNFALESHYPVAVLRHGSSSCAPTDMSFI